jgi:transcriptional regulator with XRE-family HTH domain
MATPNLREVKFEYILEQLLNDRHAGFTRKSLAEALQITPGMVSQYTRGKARPSLDTLAQVADLLGVSLDYLIFGEPTTSNSQRYADSTLQYVDIALSRLRVQTHADSAFIGRIAAALGRVLQDVAADVSSRTNQAISGTILDDETLMVEQFSTYTRLISTNLQYDILDLPGEDAKIGGRFLPVVISNLRRGYVYDFILPARDDRDWRAIVNDFNDLIRKEVGADHLARCRFKVTTLPVITGYGQYSLDVRRFEREEPLLFEQLRTWITAENQLAYAIAPSGEFQADTLMDEYHLKHAAAAYEQLWKASRAPAAT